MPNRTTTDVAIRLWNPFSTDFATIDRMARLVHGADNWSTELLSRRLRLLEYSCIVAVSRNEKFMFGYLLFRLLPGCLRVVDIATAAPARRCGVASHMTDALKSKRRDRVIDAAVPEDSVAALRFFKSQGFRATGQILYGVDGAADRFVMQYG